jgi:hypothetical protein
LYDQINENSRHSVISPDPIPGFNLRTPKLIARICTRTSWGGPLQLRGFEVYLLACHLAACRRMPYRVAPGEEILGKAIYASWQPPDAEQSTHDRVAQEHDVRPQATIPSTNS